MAVISPVCTNKSQRPSVFDETPRLTMLSLFALFVIAILVRLMWISAPGILVEREYTSAMFARSFYFNQVEIIEGWRKAIATTLKEDQPILEPPVTDFLVSMIYLAVGNEELWYARYLTSAFWIVGGIFFYKIAQMLLSTDSAVFATAYYLLVPLGISVSRSFQPDSLMMMFFLISLFCILRFFGQRSLVRLILAAIFSGLTLLIKPVVVFAIFGAFAALNCYEKGTWSRIIDRSFLIFALVSLSLPVAYYGYGILIAGYLQWKVGSSFRPHLYMSTAFWRGWLLLGVKSVGSPALIAAFLGVPLLRKPLAAPVMIGLGIGYIVFGLLFTFHIHTHDYYHLQLIPIVAICAAPLAEELVRLVRGTANSKWWLPVIGSLIFTLFFSVLDVRARQTAQVFESERTAVEIGEIVHHSDRTVFLAHHYGLPLEYYGELRGMYWPRKATSGIYRRPGERDRSVEERFQQIAFRPDYFIITDFDEYNRNHADLTTFLEKHGILLAQSDHFLVYSLKHIDWTKISPTGALMHPIQSIHLRRQGLLAKFAMTS